MGENEGEVGRRQSRGSTGEEVYEHFRDGFRTGLYKPGDRLREEEVAQRLSVSRTPVREALGRLLARGVVEPALGRGLVVRRLDRGEVLELYAMREILEGAAAALAALHASEPEIVALRDLQQRFVSSLADPQETARLNRFFHVAIVRSARNRYLGNALAELQEAIAILGPTTFLVSGRPESAAAEHDAIVDAISGRRQGEAEGLARAHIRAALRARLASLDS